MERETGFEPATLALARRCSTTELFPLWKLRRGGILLSHRCAVKQTRPGTSSCRLFPVEEIATYR